MLISYSLGEQLGQKRHGELEALGLKASKTLQPFHPPPPAYQNGLSPFLRCVMWPVKEPEPSVQRL